MKLKISRDFLIEVAGETPQVTMEMVLYRLHCLGFQWEFADKMTQQQKDDFWEKVLPAESLFAEKLKKENPIKYVE